MHTHKIALALAATLALASCSSDDNSTPQTSSNSLIATWTWDPDNELSSSAETTRPATLAFFDDATAAIEILDIPSGETAYTFCDYTAENGRLRITDRQNGTVVLLGTYSILNNTLSLNSYTYLRAADIDTKDWPTQIIGEWNNINPQTHAVTFLQFNANGSGNIKSVTTGDDGIPATSTEPFNYWVKRNYLIREYDASYGVSILSFGRFGKSLTIDSAPYTQQ